MSVAPETEDTPGTPEPDPSWWGRKGGGREVLIVALPLVISSLSWTVMTFVDRVFLKWESGNAMAAAFSASTLWFAVLCLPLGICMYCATFVSQYYGNQQPEQVGPSVWQGVWAAVFASPILMLAIPFAPVILGWAKHSPEVFELEVQYFQILCFGIPGILIAQALSTFYAGRGKTRVVMIVDSFVAVLNLVLDYLWIFGKAGFPAMGIAGAGWATVTALTIKAAIYLILFLLRENRIEFATHRLALNVKLFGRLMYYGAPSGIQLVLDVLGFTIFIMLTGRLGAIESEATSMAFSISTLAFMPIWGLAQAAAILVGQRLGEGDEDLAEQSTWTSLRVGVTYMAVISILYLAVPELFLYSFFVSSESTDRDLLVKAMSVNLLRFVAAYNMLDAALMVFVSAIKGAGDTPFVLKISLIMATVLAGMSWLGVEVLNFGVYGCWMLITLWVWILGVIYWRRFVGRKWRKMRVIEMA